MNNQVQGQSPRSYEYDDEITLVDLASMLVKRWKLMVIVFMVVVFIALAYALITPRTYQYATLYQVAEQAPSSDSSVVGSLETPEAVVAKIKNLFLGPVTRELIATTELNKLPFDISVSSLEDTHLVKLASQAATDDSALVEEAHGMVINHIQQDQKKLLERRKSNLEQELASAESSLESVKNSMSEKAGELIALYSSRAANIQSQISQLDEGRVTQMAVRSLEPVDTSRSLIMVLAIVFGGMLAVMVAFLMNFIQEVKKNLRRS